jgi:protein phosphatase
MDEITADYSVEQLLPPVELKVRVDVRVAAKTDLGRVRENNEDKFEFFIPSDDGTLARKGQVFVVCDGMGGHAAGQIASELATKTFIDVYLNHPAEDPTLAMQGAVGAANRYVNNVSVAVPSRRGMGTTLSALILLQGHGYIAQVGDSRVYRIRDGQVEQLTVDHTWVEEAVRSGLITREEGENHPYQHVITRAIGTSADVMPDIIPCDIAVGDTFVLCSDGLTNHVSDGELLGLVQANGPSEAAWKLVAAALQDGGSDNTTVVVVRIDAIHPLYS